MAQNGHAERSDSRPLSGEERTAVIRGLRSAFDPERTPDRGPLQPPGACPSD
jgi:hypothetical protein